VAVPRYAPYCAAGRVLEALCPRPHVAARMLADAPRPGERVL
jgi:hypothetical protein